MRRNTSQGTFYGPVTTPSPLLALVSALPATVPDSPRFTNCSHTPPLRAFQVASFLFYSSSFSHLSLQMEYKCHPVIQKEPKKS